MLTIKLVNGFKLECNHWTLKDFYEELGKTQNNFIEISHYGYKCEGYHVNVNNILYVKEGEDY